MHKTRDWNIKILSPRIKVDDILFCTLKVMKQPWPGMARTIYGDHERFERVYFSKFPGYYTTGDGKL